jgi:hypothetical protein
MMTLALPFTKICCRFRLAQRFSQSPSFAGNYLLKLKAHGARLAFEQK